MVSAVQDGRVQQRPAMNVPRQVLDAFNGLVANEDKKRTSAAMIILRHADQVLRGEAQGKEMPVGVKYIVHRLVTGLASNRLKAREGYFSALCYLLRLHPSSFTPPFILSLLINKNSVAMKAISKDEIRDQLVAELLLCGAVVRSGRCVGPEVLQRVVNQLCAMRSKKSYLDITATQFLVNLMESCEGDTMHAAVWESLQAELQVPVAELSPSQLWMRLVLLRKHRASPPVWLTSTLAPKNHEALGQTLMKTTTELPNIHPVVEELVSSLAASRSSSSLLTKFWQVTVEPLQGNTSPGKLQILFQFLKFMVAHLRTAAEFKGVVTSSVMSLLLNSLTQHVFDLKNAARGVTAAFVQLVKDNQQEDGEVQLAVVRVLVTPPSSVRFDQLTGHKVLALMVPHFTLKTLKGVTKTLLEVVNKPVRDLEVANRNYASHTLGSLLAQPRACTPEAATWKKKQLMALLKAVVLTPGQNEGDTAKDAFFKALGKQVGHIREYSGILLSLVEEVDQELKTLEAAGSPSTLSDKGKKQWARVISRLANLKGMECVEGTEPELAKTVFQVLYCQMALHLFVDVTVATESIEEFITCHNEVKKIGTLKGEDDEDEDEEDEEDEEEEERPNWVEVVTELLLSLMTQEMHLFRSVVQGLFWLLTPLMTATALSLLTDVLDTEKARELVKKDGEEEDDEEEKEGSDDEDDEDKDDSDEDEDDDDDDNEEEEPGEGDDPNLFTLKKKMFEVAGGIDVDVDMDSVPQEELDRMDERLGALLAEYRGKHPTRKKKRRKGGGGDAPQLPADEQSLMHFQTRVCDMLIVYIKAAPNLALQVELVNPIFKALGAADLDVRQKDLQNKLATVITALEKKKKFNTIGEISVDTWKETVNEFFSIACQMPERFVSVTQSCYSQLMHCGRLLLGMDEEAVGKPDNFFTTTYITHLETFFKHNHHLPKVLPFCEPCTYNMGGLWHVATTLLRLAFDPEVKVHKQAQALKTLQQLYGNKTLLGERSRPEAAAMEQDLCGKVVKALGSMQSPINGLFVSNLFRLLHTILQVDRRTEAQTSMTWEELQKSLEAFRERISKTALKAFRREYNVFNEGLRGLLNSKKGGKKQGMKRGVKDLNEIGKQQENQTKKRKKENKNSLTNTISLSAEGEGKEEKVKKKKKTKKNLVENIAVNEEDKCTSNQDNTSKKEEENIENTLKKIMVNGGDNSTLHQGQGNEEEKVLKKKKKKDKLTNSENSQDVTNQEENQEKKKKKGKLTDTPVITEDSSETQTQANNTEVSKEKKKKKKLTDTPAITEENSELQSQDDNTEVSKEEKKKKKKKKLTDIPAITEESSELQTQDDSAEVSKEEKKKKKKNKLEKGKQKQEETATVDGKEQIASVILTSPITPEPTPKKKKKKKVAVQENGDM